MADGKITRQWMAAVGEQALRDVKENLPVWQQQDDQLLLIVYDAMEQERQRVGNILYSARFGDSA